MIKALRAATTVQEDTQEQIKLSVKELIQEIIKLNNLTQENIISVQFSITKDIRSFNPATALRQELNWSQVPMFCAQEPDIENSLAFCIRAIIYIQDYSENPKNLKHVYLKEAKNLRADLL